MTLRKSDKLRDVCYDIRGPILREARRLEEEGYNIAKLNIGDPAQWGFEAPDEIIHDVILNLPQGQGYSESQGLFSARKAVMQRYQALGVPRVAIDDIFLGNGVSELIVMAVQGLLNNGDEVLVPAPDYPLWTAAINLAGGTVVHYQCDEAADWQPDLADIAAKVNDRTRAIVVINPNNPTGSVYERQCLEQIVALAHEHRLVIFADEIYDRILYDDAVHVPMSTLTDDCLVVTFNGLSKTYRVPGFRSGWMLLSGAKHAARDYIEGLQILAAMRLSSNVPGQLAIQTSLGGFQSIDLLTQPGGRLIEQRNALHAALNDIPGISCVKPNGAFYLFPKIDVQRFGVTDDERFILDLLLEEKILLVPGTAFSWPRPDHFRIVFLPRVDQIDEIAGGVRHFLHTYEQERAGAAATPAQSAGPNGAAAAPADGASAASGG